MLTLGIETSCDETAIALYDNERGLLSHVIHSQTLTHAAYGGVMPEQASRDHVVKILPLIESVLMDAGVKTTDLAGIAYTKGPGLVGALLVGAMLGRTLAYALNIPAIGIHHLEGHILAPFLEAHAPSFPFLALLVSGGHTELIKVEGIGRYDMIGDTLDDAVGEAFDKTAKLLGLGYPGGAKLAELAKGGVPNRFQLPRPMVDRPGLEFSFSGLKTAARNLLATHGEDAQTKADIALAFQTAAVETLTIKCQRALKQTGYQRLVVAGGVGANAALRASLQTLCAARHAELYFPRSIFCTDNGAMIAYVGCQRLMAGERDDLTVDVRARWPLAELSSITL